MGYKTPNIDRIAKEGALFTHAYAQQSRSRSRSSRPIRSCMMCGIRSASCWPRKSGTPKPKSTWRGPVWMPVNMLIVRTLLNSYQFHGYEFRVECPTGSGRYRSALRSCTPLASLAEGRGRHLTVPQKKVAITAEKLLHGKSKYRYAYPRSRVFISPNTGLRQWGGP
jgi:hypothetical protein